jgi:hypothetical protein
MNARNCVRSPFFERLNSTALYDSSLKQIYTLLNDVQLNKPALPKLWIRNRIKLITVKPIYIADVSQPILQWRNMIFRLQGGSDSSAFVVTRNDYMLNLKTQWQAAMSESDMTQVFTAISG